jgi:hypothetical protein
VTIKHWHKRVRGSEQWFEVHRVRFEVRGRKVLLVGHTSSNCDVEVTLDGEALLELMREYLANKLAMLREEDV